MSPAFTNKLLYTTQTKLPEQFLDEIKIHIENDTLFILLLIKMRLIRSIDQVEMDGYIMITG